MPSFAFDNDEEHPDLSVFMFPMLSIVICSVISSLNKKVHSIHVPDVIYQFSFFCVVSVTLHHFFARDFMEKIDERFLWERMHPQAVITMLLPPLMFESAFKLNTYLFFSNLKMILFLAFFIYLITFFLSGGIFYYFFYLDGEEQWTFGFLLAAILASVDPVTTSPVVNESGAPLRFRILMEGESAVNDGLVFFTIIMVNDFHKKSGFELGLTLYDVGTLFESFLKCFCLSPIIGIFSAQICLQILIFSGMEKRAKQLLLLVIVYSVFFIGETVRGSAAVTIASFGITLATQKEALEADFWHEAEAFWDLLSTLSTFMIFSFSGYKVGMQMLNLDGTEDFEVAQVFFFISAMFLSLVPIFCRMLAFITVYNIVEPYSSVTLTEFSLLTWGGMRGGLAMLMALTLNNFSGDIDDPFYHKLLLYTCGCVLPSILLQGTTFSQCVHLLGANLRSSYSQKAAKRLKLHLKSELAIKILELRKRFAGFLSGANWNCVNEYVSKTLFNLQYAKHEKGYVSAEIDYQTETEDDEISCVDSDKGVNYKKDIYRTYYGILLAHVSKEWKRGALSGATALSLNNLIEHAIDEGKLSFEEIQRHVNKIRLSPPGKFFGRIICLMKKWLDYGFNRRLSQVSDGYVDKDFDEQKKVQQKSWAPEFWWIFSTTLSFFHTMIVSYIVFASFCPLCLPLLYLTFTFNLWWIGEHFFMIRKNLKNTDKKQKYLNVIYASAILFVTVAEILIAAWMLWPKEVNDKLRPNCISEYCEFSRNFERCIVLKWLFYGLSILMFLLKLFRTVPMAIFIAADMVVQRKYKLERIRLSALNLLQHMTSEMRFSKDLFPTTKDYNLALKVNHDFNQIIDAMLRIELKSNKATLDMLSVIKTRQAMRMVGYELNQSITNLSNDGFTEPESREKWLHRIELLKDIAEDLIDVPPTPSIDKLRDVDWIYLLPFEQQEYVVQKLSEFIETGNLEIVSNHGCIYTHGTHLFFIRKGICKVTEIQNVKQNRICHDYYINDGSFIGIKNIFKMGKNGNRLQSLKNLETSFRACTDVELVKIEASKWQKLFQDVPEPWGTISMVEQKRRLRADLKRVSSEYGLMTDAEIAHETLTFFEVRGKKILSLGVGKVFIPGIALHIVAHPESRIDEFRNVLGPANVTIQPITPEIVGLYLELIRPDMSERELKSSMIAANIPTSPDTTERRTKQKKF